MNPDDTYIIEQMECEPDLPKGFVGGFERVINDRTGDASTCLYVFMLLASGKKAYVGAFYGAYTLQAEQRFGEWWLAFSDKNQAV